MKTKAAWVVGLAISFISTGAICSSYPYDPGLYVYWNEIVVEGTLISNNEVPEESRLEQDPGWFFPTNRACVLVNRAAWQNEGPAVEKGDTLCFRYRTSNIARNEDVPDIMRQVGNGETGLGVAVGTTGLYSIGIARDGSLRKGVWFSLSEVQECEVLDFISKLQLDFSGTVKELKKSHPGVRIDWGQEKE